MALLERSSRIVRPFTGWFGPAWLGSRWAGRAAMVAVVYFAAAKFGLSLASETRQVTAVFPPTGIALGRGLKFPTRWQNVMFMADWAYGRIYAAFLTPCGASYRATIES